MVTFYFINIKLSRIPRNPLSLFIKNKIKNYYLIKGWHPQPFSIVRNSIPLAFPWQSQLSRLFYSQLSIKKDYFNANYCLISRRPKWTRWLGNHPLYNLISYIGFLSYFTLKLSQWLWLGNQPVLFWCHMHTHYTNINKFMNI